MSGPRTVDRALALLDAVADARGPVSAKALARHVGCSLSTVYHLLGALTERGHLVRGPQGYALGPRVPALHRSFQRQLGMQSAVGTLLAQVQRAAGAEAYFTAYNDGHITIVDSTAPPADAVHPFPPGPETRAHATAHGKVLLAQLPQAARRRYLADHGMTRITEHTITSAARFEAELAGVRRRGIAVSIGEADTDYTCLAMPLADAPGRALSVSLPRTAFPGRRNELISVLRLAVAMFPAMPE
ncbi:IclR family transcriptional regulator [Streptomyces sp. NPDC003832]